MKKQVIKRRQNKKRGGFGLGSIASAILAYQGYNKLIKPSINYAKNTYSNLKNKITLMPHRRAAANALKQAISHLPKNQKINKNRTKEQIEEATKINNFLKNHHEKQYEKNQEYFIRYLTLPHLKKQEKLNIDNLNNLKKLEDMEFEDALESQ
jgi:hypothetical protein